MYSASRDKQKDGNEPRGEIIGLKLLQEGQDLKTFKSMVV